MSYKYSRYTASKVNLLVQADMKQVSDLIRTVNYLGNPTPSWIQKENDSLVTNDNDKIKPCIDFKYFFNNITDTKRIGTIVVFEHLWPLASRIKIIITGSFL